MADANSNVNAGLLSQILNRNDTIAALLNGLNQTNTKSLEVDQEHLTVDREQVSTASAVKDINLSDDSISRLGATIGQSVGTIINTTTASNLQAFQQANQQQTDAVSEVIVQSQTPEQVQPVLNEPQQSGDDVPSAQEITTNTGVIDARIVDLGEMAERDLSSLFSFSSIIPGADKKETTKAVPVGDKEDATSIIGMLGSLLGGAGLGVGAATAGIGFGAGQVLQGAGGLVSGIGKGIGSAVTGIGKGIGSIFGFGGDDEDAGAQAGVAAAKGANIINPDTNMAAAVREGTVPIVLQLAQLRREIGSLKERAGVEKEKHQSEKLLEAKEKIISEKIETKSKEVDRIIKPDTVKPQQQKPKVEQPKKTSQTKSTPTKSIATAAGGLVKPDKSDEPTPVVARSVDTAKPQGIFERVKSFFTRDKESESIEKNTETNNIQTTKAVSVPQDVKNNFVNKSVTQVKNENSKNISNTSQNIEKEPEEKKSFFDKAKSFVVDKGSSLLDTFAKDYGFASDDDTDTDSEDGISEEVITQQHSELMQILSNIDTNVSGMRSEFPEAIATSNKQGGMAMSGGSNESGPLGDTTPIGAQRDLNRSA